MCDGKEVEEIVERVCFGRDLLGVVVYEIFYELVLLEAFDGHGVALGAN